MLFEDLCLGRTRTIGVFAFIVSPRAWAADGLLTIASLITVSVGLSQDHSSKPFFVSWSQVRVGSFWDGDKHIPAIQTRFSALQRRERRRFGFRSIRAHGWKTRTNIREGSEELEAMVALQNIKEW